MISRARCDAVNWASRLPSQYQSAPAVQEQLRLVRAGVEVMQRVKQDVDNAQAAGRRNDIAGRDQYLRAAQRDASADPRFAACANKLVPGVTAAPSVPQQPPPAGGCTPVICTQQGQKGCAGSPTPQTFYKECVANMLQRCTEGEAGRTGGSCVRKGADPSCQAHAQQVCQGAANRFGYPAK